LQRKSKASLTKTAACKALLFKKPLKTVSSNKSQIMNVILLQFFLFVSLLFAQCTADPEILAIEETRRQARFADARNMGEIQHPELIEASGMVVSRSNPGLIWVHNDSGDKSRLFLIDTNGRHYGIFNVVGTKNRDWEDIAIGPGPERGKNYIYIGDIGDNIGNREIKQIYRVPEPDLKAMQLPADRKIRGAETISFRYPDGNRDAETLIVDPFTRDIYVVSKREPMVHVYLAKYPQPVNEIITLEHVATLDISIATGGDISSNGREILIRTYADIYYWVRKNSEPLAETFKREPKRLPYEMEPQGEAIAWKVDGSGYFTLSEKIGEPMPVLYFYERLK
jgi:hypothetical protein